jgi:hypothetical protein
MALIWADGFAGDRALAPKLRRYLLAQARADDNSLSVAERAAALVAALQAKNEYDLAVIEADTTFGQNRTHVLIAGVGAYDDANIQAVTTSVHGARTFAEWMLTRFTHESRPLGSVEMVLSPEAGQGDWQPGPEAAAKLGLNLGEALPLEKATFNNLETAFGRWLARAGARMENAAWFYYSGHGVFKGVPFVLPQDAQMPTDTQPLRNLIDLTKTAVNLQNRPPRLHCFFIDACQEIPLALLQVLPADPGKSLTGATTATPLDQKDFCQYHGSYPGVAAYGPDNAAPFFTQELLKCLERRGAQGKSPSGLSWMVTTSSLRQALEAAGRCRAEIEKRKLKFAVLIPIQPSFTADLCQYLEPSEAFVQLWCTPRDKMPGAKLFLRDTADKRFRPAPGLEDWFMTVAAGQCEAGVEFDAATGLAALPRQFNAAPPVSPIEILVQGQNPGAAMGGGTGGT